MNIFYHRLFSLLLFGLFSLSKAKPCPERARPHKTRCDLYYKCTELKAGKHVWVPARCEEGLIYEHSLAVCVLPADDWECTTVGNHKINTSLNSMKEQQQTELTNNRDADIYIVPNPEDEDDNLKSKLQDVKMEIIIGPDISSDDKNDEESETIYDGSGNGGDLVELDGFLPAQNRESEVNNITVLKQEEATINKTKNNPEVQKIELKEDLEGVLQTIKTKAEIGEPSTNIDPKLTANLQRLSQLIDGLKQTYQAPKGNESLRPDQLNAFLAHFNIKNKFDSLDPNVNFVEKNGVATVAPNRTFYYNHDIDTKLNPETKVVLSKTIPHLYGGSNHDNGNSAGGYSSSQIFINRPEGSVHFSLPKHHYTEHSEYSPGNTPKISEETLKTVLELSKQLITEQNVPKIISSPNYYNPPIMQPILLTPHIDSPFSSNYVSQSANSLGFSGQYNNQNHRRKKPGEKLQHSATVNRYNDNENDNYESYNDNGYGSFKPGTTIIHNNIIPVHVAATTSSEEKDVLDSYGQNLNLYPPLHNERPDSNTDYHGTTNTNNGYSSGLGLQVAEYSVSTTKSPWYATSNPYSTTPRPLESTPSSISQYFTPSEHLGNHNVNNVFSSVDNYGSIPRPMKGKRPNLQNYNHAQDNEDNNAFPNQIYPQINSHKVYTRPNYQNSDNFGSENNHNLDSYSDASNEDESEVIIYTYGTKKKPEYVQHPANGESGAQGAINSVFSTNNPYIARPQTTYHNSISSATSPYSTGNNKFTSQSSPISTAYEEGTQLVNVGGNFISLDIFQNSVLPLLSNNPTSFSASLNHIEVITCLPGVRQPNATDCARYYVCSKKDGKVLSYSCPPYTGFNSDTRICDAKSYSICNNNPIVPSYSSSENKRIQMETLQTLQEAKRRHMLKQQQQQALKAQNMINYLQQYNLASSPSFSIPLPPFLSSDQYSSEQSTLNSYIQHAGATTEMFATTARPQYTTTTGKKRKYYCKEGDKIADQTSIYNYFVCYKNNEGQMKGHKLTCSKGLIFCQKTTVCTLPSKCL